MGVGAIRETLARRQSTGPVRGISQEALSFLGGDGAVTRVTQFRCQAEVSGVGPKSLHMNPIFRRPTPLTQYLRRAT